MFYEYLGYAASVIVLISLLMSTVKRLRWINLIGSITFATYGFLIDSIPVAILNIGTAVINVYYLTRMYNTKDYFKILEFDVESKYFKNFLDFYRKDLFHFFSPENIDMIKADMSFYILRNLKPAGVFLGNEISKDELEISLDYVVPEFRDFQMGKYLYTEQRQLFLDKGYKKLVTKTDVPKHEKYLKKMGFVKTEICENGICRFELVL